MPYTIAACFLPADVLETGALNLSHALLKKMIAARTSPARFVRHNLGLKAPRGWGWLTNPKRAAYNRIYSRTTFSLWGLLRLIFGGRR